MCSPLIAGYNRSNRKLKGYSELAKGSCNFSLQSPSAYFDTKWDMDAIGKCKDGGYNEKGKCDDTGRWGHSEEVPEEKI